MEKSQSIELTYRLQYNCSAVEQHYIANVHDVLVNHSQGSSSYSQLCALGCDPEYD